MSITEDIYSGFFQALEEKQDFPKTTISALRRLLENSVPFSEDNIKKAIEEGDKDDAQD